MLPDIWELLVDHLHEAIVVFDGEHKIAYVNLAFTKFFGYRPEEVLGEPARGLHLSPASYADFEGEPHAVARERGVWQGEWDLRAKDGSVLGTEMTLVRLDGGGSKGYAATIRNITKLQQTEADLRKSEELFTVLSEKSLSPLGLINSEGRYEYVNPIFVETFGYDLNDIKTGRDWFRLAFPDEKYRQSVKKAWLNDLQRYSKGDSRPRICQVRCKNGECKTILFKSVTTASRSQIIFYEDITEKENAGRRLQESEERYRIVVDLSPDPMLIHRSGTVIFANQAALTLLGLESMDDILGKPIWNYNHPPEQSGLAKERLRLMESGHIAPWQEYNLKRPDGKKITVEATGRVMPFPGGDVVLTVWRDLTERRRAEKEKNRLESQLRQAQKMEAIGVLAGGIAHDFNNILSAVIGYAELLKLDLGGNADVRRKVDQILKAGMRARDLVQQILTFSRRTEQKLANIQLSLIVKEALKLLRASLPANIEIETQIESNASILADPTQLHQVIMNLCTNAGHAMRDGGGLLRVELREVKVDEAGAAMHPNVKPGTYLNLIVSDTGSGMDPNLVPRIFEPFFTTKGPGEGTGMGLSMVHGIVTGLGGMITVYSEPGTGTAFKVFFPIDSPRPKPEVNEIDLSAYRGTERILIVDDEETITQAVGQLLQRLGYKTEIRTDSQKALECFRCGPDRIDLVLTDITMPGMTGDQLAKKLHRIRPGLPIIMTSGLTSRISPQKTVELGVSAMISKPFETKQLAKAIRQAIDGKLI